MRMLMTIAAPAILAAALAARGETPRRTESGEAPGCARAVSDGYGRRHRDVAGLERETRRSPRSDGWDDGLTVAGLFFLPAGETSFGSGPLRDIVLPDGPPDAGVFVRRDGRVTVRAAAGSSLTVDGEAVTSAELWPYENERPELTLGPLTLFAHASGPRLAVRMRDRNSAILRDFAGLDWYPVDADYRVRGRFIPHDTPREVRIQNILGDVETFTSSGTVRLSIRGEEMDLLPVDSGDQLWFIFRDLTSGSETYPAARFLYADPPRDGWTTVDFNKAYNPPCAFNPHTTCPLPPRANRLPLRIEAGERDYRGRHE